MADASTGSEKRKDEPTEREVKFSGVDLDALRVRLRELEAESQGPPTLEDNRLFDRDGELTDKRTLLRLRSERRGTRLTYKGPSSYEGRIKVRTELETTVGSLETATAILQALGYSQVHRYQKYREEWLLGSIVIALDHTPIGDFVEFEGPGCDRVASRCGLDLDASERRNYLRLYEDYRAENPDAPPEMIFPGNEDTSG